MTEGLLTSLLATKLSLPRSRRTLVVRPRLIKQLDTSRGYPLTLVAAPAGFGKTTLLAEWAAQRRYPLAWLSLDTGDNDPLRFWSYVIAALETVQPGSGRAAAQAFEAPQAPAFETLLTALINALASSPSDLGLILDDYQIIECPEIHAGVTFLLDHAPATLHLIIATRADPILPLARLRARDGVLEVRAADLRFNAGESSEFLQTVMRLPLNAEQVAALEVRTEGWIAGLQLAALALAAQDAEGIPDFIAASAGNNRYVIDYLVEEVLGGQEVEVQDFLCQTSILDRLCPTLCDAVTGRTGSAEMLARLERRNLFLTRLDQEGVWHRYHNLFADVLRKSLSQRHPDLVPDLHRRAAGWYGEHGMLRDAIDHALAVPDPEQAARLIVEAGIPAVGAAEALITLITRALSLAARQGHVHGLADKGDAVVALIAEGRGSGGWDDTVLSAHAHRVLAAWGVSGAGRSPLVAGRGPGRDGVNGQAGAAPAARAAALVEPLSRRELEVLRLVADGLGNRDIADRLIVSVGTVKSHIHNIYGKLGAQDRGQAIAQAQELQLL